MAGHSGPRIAKSDISLQLDAGNAKAFKFKTRLYDYGLWANGPTSEYFPGTVYNAMLYNRALSPQEISQNYDALKGRFGLT